MNQAIDAAVQADEDAEVRDRFDLTGHLVVTVERCSKSARDSTCTV